MEPPKNPKYGDKYLAKTSYSDVEQYVFYVGDCGKKTAYFITENSEPYFYSNYDEPRVKFTKCYGSLYSHSTYVACEAIRWSKVKEIENSSLISTEEGIKDFIENWLTTEWLTTKEGKSFLDKAIKKYFSPKK